VQTTPTPAPSSGGSTHRRTTTRSNESSSTVTSRITSSSSNNSTAAPAGGGGSGFLSISTRPASRCSVAGQTFSTPRLRLSLPSGTHRVSCTNSDFNVSSSFSVTIRAGQETREINHPLN
jgi:hypothetical protein